jgi:hypothetical protein
VKKRGLSVAALIVAVSLVGVTANSAGVLNSPSGGYLVCVDSKTKFVTHPGTTTCPKGSKKLVLGAQGLDGAPGLAGAAGLSGKDANTLWSGVQDPENTLGSPGDMFINSQTKTLFGPKDSTTGWSIGVSIVGPKGEQGARGLTGLPGPRGLTGFEGPRGLTGLTGPRGLTGLTGPRGLTGFEGPRGLTGLTGPRGFTGLTGAIGTTGPTGATGAQGPIGLTGLNGANGSNGATGATGAPGTNGTNGNSGVVAVTAPITNSGTSTSATLGFDYSVLLDSLGMSTTAIDTIPRWTATGTPETAVGVTFFTFFTPVVNMTVSQITMGNGLTAASGLTLARMGLFTWVEGTNTATLVARTANDISLFNGTYTNYTRVFDAAGGYPTSYNLIAGRRYATGVIQVGTTASRLLATGMFPQAGELMPRLSGYKSGQTDLATSTTVLTRGIAYWSRVS